LQVRAIGGAAPLRLFFISVASKGLNVYVSGLESTLAGISTSVDSKGVYVALELCKVAYSRCVYPFRVPLREAEG
jgi:hypothetical protein